VHRCRSSCHRLHRLTTELGRHARLQDCKPINGRLFVVGGREGGAACNERARMMLYRRYVGGAMALSAGIGQCVLWQVKTRYKQPEDVELYACVNSAFLIRVAARSDLSIYKLYAGVTTGD